MNPLPSFIIFYHYSLKAELLNRFSQQIKVSFSTVLKLVGVYPNWLNVFTQRLALFKIAVVVSFYEFESS